MNDADREKTAFACHRSLFEFNVMPFGLTSVPAIFQELVSIVLQELAGFASAYLDDILIYSKSLEEYPVHIQTVFARLRQHGLKLKLKKCQFLQAETNYLGFVINREVIKPCEKTLEAIRTLPVSTCVRDYRNLTDMCSYYRRFIPNFSEIAEPIIALTRKYAKFRWTEQYDKTSNFLKDSLTVIPFLYPDPNKPYVLYTDASNASIRACLTQECEDNEEVIPDIKHEKPIYYLSHKLSDTQKTLVDN